MDEFANAPSNGADEGVSAPENTANEAPASSGSTREALERAFQTVGGDTTGDTTNTGRARDEAGRFARAEQQAAQEGQEGQQAPQAPTGLQAPQRFTREAQEAWAGVPDVVRIETERALTELTQGLEKYKGSHEAYEAVRQFDEMARQSGTTLDEALSRYTQMEGLLAQDPIQCMATIAENMGFDIVDVAQHILGIAGQQGQRGQGQQTPQVAALEAQIRALQEQIGGVTNTLTTRDAEAEVSRFAETHPHFDDLAGDIAEMIATGYASNLEDAYNRALRMNPQFGSVGGAPGAGQAANPAAPAGAAQTRKANLSTTGSPASGSNPSTRKPAGSTREALERALSQVGL